MTKTSQNQQNQRQSQFTIDAIGIVSSPFKEKFGIPRQPALAKNITSDITIVPPFNVEAFNELSTFSHIWLTFVFHQHAQTQWKPCIRPPRLGGNKKVGVFASRSSFRPNSLGMSVVELVAIEELRDTIKIVVKGADLVDGTPIVDIKPYIPYTDAIVDANAGYANQAPESPLSVWYSKRAKAQLTEIDPVSYPNLAQIIDDVLSADPRPAYKKPEDSKMYGVKLYDFDIKWQVTGNTVEVISIDRC